MSGWPLRPSDTSTFSTSSTSSSSVGRDSHLNDFWDWQCKKCVHGSDCLDRILRSVKGRCERKEDVPNIVDDPYEVVSNGASAKVKKFVCDKIKQLTKKCYE